MRTTPRALKAEKLGGGVGLSTAACRKGQSRRDQGWEPFAKSPRPLATTSPAKEGQPRTGPIPFLSYFLILLIWTFL